VKGIDCGDSEKNESCAKVCFLVVYESCQLNFTAEIAEIAEKTSKHPAFSALSAVRRKTNGTRHAI
jgi:hypothetical protein